MDGLRAWRRCRSDPVGRIIAIVFGLHPLQRGARAIGCDRPGRIVEILDPIHEDVRDEANIRMVG